LLAQGNASFTPADLSPLAWYQAGDSVRNGPIAANPGDPVTAWLDSSGNGNHLLSNQAPTMRPTLNAAGFIEGDGGDFLACPNLHGQHIQPIRIVALAQYTAVTSNAFVWSSANQSTFNLYARSVSGNRLTAHAGGTLGEIQGPVADTTQRLYEVLYRGTSSSLRLDGLDVDSTGNIGQDPITSLGLFGQYNTGNVLFGSRIKIWELVVLQGTAATDANAARIRKYFADKFGIKLIGSTATLLSTQTFGSGLTYNNPSQHSAMSISEPVPGQRFLAIGDQDMAQLYAPGRKGCVQVFKEVAGAWVLHQRLVSPLNRAGQWMGHGLRSGGAWIMCGNTHSVGNPIGGEGEVEVWKFDGMTGRFEFHSVLQPPDAKLGDEFGMLHDMDAENGWAIVSSCQADPNGVNEGGKVFFYKLENDVWVQKQTVTEPGGPLLGNKFGVEVCIKGNHAFAHAHSPSPGQYGGKYFIGVVYHYILVDGVWTYNATLTRNPQTVGKCFGKSLAFDGTRLISFDWGIKNFVDGGFTVFRLSGSSWTQEFTYTDINCPGFS
jgi:hypothetical protein